MRTLIVVASPGSSVSWKVALYSSPSFSVVFSLTMSPSHARIEGGATATPKLAPRNALSSRRLVIIVPRHSFSLALPSLLCSKVVSVVWPIILSWYQAGVALLENVPLAVIAAAAVFATIIIHRSIGVDT